MIQTRRLPALLLVLLLLLPALPVVAQDAPSETRRMLSHAARFTAEIPADWHIDRSQEADYIAPDGRGYIVTATYGASQTSLVDVCRSVAPLFGAADAPDRVITWTFFQGQPACTLGARAATAPEDPIGLVFLHPNPLRSSIDASPYFRYAGVMIDRAHFDAITASISFDLDDVGADLYLESAIDLMEAHALVRDEVDWEAVRADAAAAITGDDPLPGLDIALSALEAAGDDHSYRWDATQFDAFVDTSAEDIDQSQLPASIAIGDAIGYLTLPPIQGDSSVYSLYATAGNQAIAAVDTPETCGWIIDLRTNFGGNSDPMVAAIGEILGDGPFAGFLASDGTVELEAYADGAVYPVGEEPGDSLIEGGIHTPAQPDAPVALLIGPVTGSSAEYTAIGFLGRENVRTFGEASSGLTSGIDGFILVDGAALGLATSAMIDRNETPYPDGIAPDTEVPYETASLLDPEDPVTAAATEWLLAQPSCQ